MINTPRPYGHPAWIEIDLNQFQKNVAVLKKQVEPSRICLPIKANAYGHGLIEMGLAAQKAQIDYLAVSCLQEGAQLRLAGVNLPILVMGAIHEEQIPQLLDYELELSISSAYKAKLVASFAQKLKKTAKIHLEIDTGMQRTGMKPETALTVLNYLFSNPYFSIKGIYTHFATASEANDRFAKKQLDIFKAFISRHIKPHHPHILCHIANSGGLAYYPESYLDMVRPGLLAYGYFPSQIPPQLSQIKPFFALKAKIAYSKWVDPDVGISYGHSYKTQNKAHIITVPVGYGDGYRRALSNKACVLIHEKPFPIAGTICMDQFMVDLNQEPAQIGDEIVLIGQQGKQCIDLETIASLCDTIAYEILCGFNMRLPRVYC